MWFSTERRPHHDRPRIHDAGQAAIDALNEYFARIGKLKRRGLTKGEKAISLDVVGAIKALPFAQPEKIRGRWENRSIKFATHNATIWWYACSVCGGNAINGGIRTDFCPHCGADMREQEGKA